MPSDRHAEGLAGDLTVRENATLRGTRPIRHDGIVNRASELKRVGASLRLARRQGAEHRGSVSSLSGGNQQKVVMARALLSEPGLIVADEPTQGVDVGARAEIYRILREVSNSGAPVIVNSSDAAELEGLCDKVMVMSRGRVVETLTRRRRRRSAHRRRRGQGRDDRGRAEGGRGDRPRRREAAGGISSSSTTRRPFP